MLFGEIVEPSTRALLEESDSRHYKDLEWVLNVEPPEKIKKLLISESTFANALLKACLIDKAEPLCKTAREEIIIYKRRDDCVIVCKVLPDVSVGEIIKNILNWVENSEEVYAITTAPRALYQNVQNNEQSPIVLRMLSTQKSTLLPPLETPNLITGVGAGILSFCVHARRNCSLFVGYVNVEPLDSLNSGPFLDLLSRIDVRPLKNYTIKEQLSTSNLYM